MRFCSMLPRIEGATNPVHTRAKLTMSRLVYAGTGAPLAPLSSARVPSGLSRQRPIEKSCMISRAKFSSGRVDEYANDSEPW